MGIKNTALALAVLAGGLGGVPDKPQDHGSNPDSGRPVSMAPDVAGPKEAAHDQAKAAIDTAQDGGEDSPEAQKALIAKILQECPDLGAMIAKQDPELHAMLKADHPGMLQASVIGGLLSALYSLVKLLYGVVGGEGTIIIVILMAVFGVVPVLRTGWKGAKWAVNKASGSRGPDELGETIPKKDLPALNAVLGEVVTDATVAVAGLTPGHRGELNTHYDFVVNQFDHLKFVEKDEGIGMFKLAIKEFYLALRLDEIIASLTGPEAVALPADQRTALETELADLVPKESRIIGEMASNPLKVASVARGREDAVTANLKRKVSDVMRGAARPAPAITSAQEGVGALVTIPRLHKVDSNLREIRILENKLKMWRGRYDTSLRIAGPGMARPAVGATTQQQYDRAAAFVGVYEGLGTTLRDRQEAAGFFKRKAYAAESYLPTGPKARTLVNIGVAAALIYGGSWGARGVVAAQEAIFPPEPPAAEAPSEADELEDQNRREDEKNTESEARRSNRNMSKDSERARGKKSPYNK